MRTLRRISTVTLLALTAAASTAAAKPAVSKTGQVQVDLPDAWNAAAQGDTLLIAGDKNKEVVVVFMVLPEQETDKALAALEAKLGKDIKNEKWNAAQAVSLNGLSGASIDGTADVKGKPCAVAAMVLHTPNKHDVVVFGAVQSAKEAAHHDELVGILKSLRPLK